MDNQKKYMFVQNAYVQEKYKKYNEKEAKRGHLPKTALVKAVFGRCPLFASFFVNLCTILHEK